MNDDTRIRSIFDFWFGAPGSAEYGSDRKIWWQKDDAFDAEIRERFLGDVEAAAAGELDPWGERIDGTLALILLFDQFPRNLFRGSARAFATDPQARAQARRMRALGWDLILPPFKRQFAYMPFEHSESIADQELAVRLLGGMNFADNAVFAWRHRDIVDRFGRFPHRNEALGRTSTAEEAAFLTQPNSSF